MKSQVSLLPNQLSVASAWEFHETVLKGLARERQDILQRRSDGKLPDNSEFRRMTLKAIDAFFDDMEREAERQTCLLLVATAEGILRADFRQRAKSKDSDPIAKAFRDLYQDYSAGRGGGKEVPLSPDRRVGLKDSLLEVWKQHLSEKTRQDIRMLSDAINYRHWLAHGRYWQPWLGRQHYNPLSIKISIDNIFSEAGIVVA